MRLIRPRFTVRRLLVAVAAVGLVIGIANLAHRRQHFRKQALKHEILEFFSIHGHHHGGPEPARASFHASMRHKYERATGRPWLAVESDPPRPP